MPPPRAFHTAYSVQNHLCVFGGMNDSGLIKETDVYTSTYDSREGRWHKRSIAVPDANLGGDFTGACCSRVIDTPAAGHG